MSRANTTVRTAMLYIGVLQFTLEIPYAETLKDKRNAV